jgi:hypothetical protein
MTHVHSLSSCDPLPPAGRVHNRTLALIGPEDIIIYRQLGHVWCTAFTRNHHVWALESLQDDSSWTHSSLRQSLLLSSLPIPLGRHTHGLRQPPPNVMTATISRRPSQWGSSTSVPAYSMRETSRSLRSTSFPQRLSVIYSRCLFRSAQSHLPSSVLAPGTAAGL